VPTPPPALETSGERAVGETRLQEDVVRLKTTRTPGTSSRQTGTRRDLRMKRRDDEADRYRVTDRAWRIAVSTISCSAKRLHVSSVSHAASDSLRSPLLHERGFVIAFAQLRYVA
jgi:hypothetical protein